MYSLLIRGYLLAALLYRAVKSPPKVKNAQVRNIATALCAPLTANGCLYTN